MKLKEAVYNISRYRAFNPVGRSLYNLCSRIVALVFLTTPEIRSAYLSGSMSGGEIVPGLSDIDFVITIRDMDAEAEFRFMTGLERSIRYLLPPYGQDKVGVHVAVYSSSEWRLLGNLFLGKKMGEPRRLFSKDRAATEHKFDETTMGLHHFYKALWKLEALEDSIGHVSVNNMEQRLRRRVMERTLVGIENGVSEITGDTEPSAGYKEMKNQIVDLLTMTRDLDGTSIQTDILTRLLHLFDLAVSRFYDPFEDGYITEDSDARAADIYTINDPQLKELVTEISAAPGRYDCSGAILIKRYENYDFFLYEPARYDITGRLLNLYRAKGNRGLRIMSIKGFRKFYLYNPSETVGFIDLMDGKPKTLVGKFDINCFIISLYSLFPQLRSPRNFKSLRRYDTLLKRVSDTARPIERAGNRTSRAEGYSDEYKDGNPENSDYSRFQGLKSSSRRLGEILSEILNTES